MAVNPQLTNIAFAGGIDEAQRSEVVDPSASFLSLENGRQVHLGSYDKRHGFSALTLSRYDGTSRSAGYKLISDGQVPCVIDGAQLDAYDHAKATWKTVGRLPEADYRVIATPSAGLNTFANDIEYCNGFFAITYSGYTISGGVTTEYAFVAIVNASTGAFVRPPEQIDSSSSLGITAVVGSYSSRYFILFAGNRDVDINVYYLDMNSASSINTGWVSLGAGSSGANWDVTKAGPVVCSLSDRVALAYTNISGGASLLTVRTWNVSGMIESTNINTTSVATNSIDMCGSSADTLWVGWAEGTLCRLRGLTPSAVGTPLATTATIVTASASSTVLVAQSSAAGKGRMWAQNATNCYSRGFQTSAGAAATDGSTNTYYGLCMFTRPYQYSGRYYAFFCTTKNTNDVNFLNSQQNAILSDWSTDAAFVRPVVNVAPGLVSTASAFSKTVAGPTATKLYSLLTIVKSSVGNSPSIVELDFAGAQRWKPVQVGSATFMAGGLVTVFDGKQVCEVGFLSRPSKPTTTNAGTGITGTFKYVAVFEEVDGNGNWTVSGISDPSASVTVLNKTITVSTNPLTISARLSTASNQASGVRVAFYRTATGAVAPYYRLGVSTNTLGSLVSYADAIDDTTLTAGAKLYAPNLPGTVPGGTTGESLDRRAPPGLAHLVSYNGMLVGASGSDIYHSGQQVSGESTWFNPVFQLNIEGDGDITGLAAQDGALFVFKRRSAYAITGDPPSDNGATGGLGLPRRLAVDVGCIDARSVVVTALGTFFQSERGIEILTRSQTVEWIGQQVQDQTTSYPIITAATLDVANGLVYFECAATETSNQVSGSGHALVYDLTTKQWVSKDRRTNNAGTADTPAQSGAIIWNGTAYRYAWLGTDGRVYVEDTTTYLDPNSAWITMAAETAWFKTAGLQGSQHVNKALVLAKSNTGHDLNLSIAYDYSSSYKTARTFTRAQIDTLTAVIPNEQLWHPMHDDAHCEAVRFKLSDATPSSGSVGTGQGATWIGVTLEVVPKQGAYLLPDTAG